MRYPKCQSVRALQSQGITLTQLEVRTLRFSSPTVLCFCREVNSYYTFRKSVVVLKKIFRSLICYSVKIKFLCLMSCFEGQNVFVILDTSFYFTRRFKEGKLPCPVSVVLVCCCCCLAMEEVFCDCLLYTSPSPRDSGISRMPSSA